MTTPLPVGPLTPYITPSLLTSAPTGISWSTIPPGKNVTAEQRYAEQLNICMRATGEADLYCNQVLRATMDTELHQGPNFRITIQNSTGNARMILDRWPVVTITQIQVSPNAFPRQWTTVPTGMYDVENPVMGLYGTTAPSASGEGGQAILIAPGFISWACGRNGYLAKVTFINGWPHTSLTQPVAAGATTIAVDDCTGWAITVDAGQSGATGVMYDMGSQEVVQVTAASVASGPGTLTLASALQYAHAAGVLVTTLPGAIQEAVIWFATAQALTRGATSTTIPVISGGGGGGAANPGASPNWNSPSGLVDRGRRLLVPFKRVI